uniref:Uncharacterized protein n=1 Tax=Arundo donax TaxID=35708 RepID=A0A0A9D645_ARUDO
MISKDYISLRFFFPFNHRNDILNSSHRLISYVRQVEYCRPRSKPVNRRAIASLPVLWRLIPTDELQYRLPVFSRHRQRRYTRHVVGSHRLRDAQAFAPLRRCPHRRRGVPDSLERAAHLHARRRHPRPVREDLPLRVVLGVGVYDRRGGASVARVFDYVAAVDLPEAREGDLPGDVDAAVGEVGEVLHAAVIGVDGLRGDRAGGGVGEEGGDGLGRDRGVGVAGVGLLHQGELGGVAARRGEGEGAMGGVGEEDGVGREAGGKGVGGERGGDVRGGEGVGGRAREVGPDGERAEVRGGSVVGTEGEEEGLVVGRGGREEEEVEGGREGCGDEELERVEPCGRAAVSRGLEERDPRSRVAGPVLVRHGAATGILATRRR